MPELVSQEQDLSSFRGEPMKELWHCIKSRLSAEFGQKVYQSWLDPLAFHDFIAGRFVVAAPTRFMRDWVSSNCSSRILDILKGEHPRIFAFDVVVDQDLASAQPPAAVTAAAQAHLQGNTQPKDAAGPLAAETLGGEGDWAQVETIGSRLEPRYVFDTFVVGKPNELAHAAALRVAESEKVHFNPLFLYGGVGLGKTHLMHAIAWHIHKVHPQRKVVYLSAEKFMYLFIRALRYKDTVSFKEKFRNVDVLMIDDFQFISGKESTQEEFFHTFNALVDQNHQVIISADKSPSDLEGLEDRMRSRLGWGLVADVHPTTYELRLGILQSKVEQLGLEIPQKVLEFLAYKISSNVRELEGALNRIVAHSTLVGRDITVETTQEVLKDVLRSNDRRVSIEKIQQEVAAHFNIKLADMHSSKRLRNLVQPRQIAMYLAKTLTESSLPEIGRKFGGRDHTTVLHAVRVVEKLILEDPSCQQDIDLLTRVLQV